jgi:hypothetical protein
MMAAYFFIVFFFYPETKGITLEAMQKKLENPGTDGPRVLPPFHL